jgi:outer membrane lipoprotein-sorting protein
MEGFLGSLPNGVELDDEAGSRVKQKPTAWAERIDMQRVGVAARPLIDTLSKALIDWGIGNLLERTLARTRRHWVGLTLLPVLLATSGCAVRRTTRIPSAQLPPPAREASLAELVHQTNAQSEAVRTFSATVDLEPTAGSIYSGVIKEYHDVKGFILAERPAMIRMIGQAPIVRTNIFDMVSDGREFRLSIPPKRKFIVGKTDFKRPAKNALENLRPQHILEALLIPPTDPASEKLVLEEAEEGGRRYYVLMVLGADASGNLQLKRKVWFDRADLQIARLQLYAEGGVYLEDVWYSGYQDFGGVRYPTHIQVSRPIEDYRLAINIQKATFNQPIDPEKFELQKPEGAQLVELGSARRPEEIRGQ